MTSRIGRTILVPFLSMLWLTCAADGQNRPGAGTGGIAASQPQTSFAAAVQWIDVHNHLIAGKRKDYTGAVDAAVAAMDKAGIKKLIAMPPPEIEGMPGVSDYDDFLPIFRKHPGRFAVMGGGGSLNVMIQKAAQQAKISDDLRSQFEKKAGEILKTGAVGFGEISIHHLSLHGDSHPYESVAADHPLLLLLADIAAKNDVVIDIHFDVVAEDMKALDWMQTPPNPKTFPANLAAFERLLEHNPKARICWAHAGSDNTGQWTTALTRKLLEKHPNLYMSLRMGPAHTPGNYPLSPDGKIKREWLSLFQDYPARFVIGSDQFIFSPTVEDSGMSGILSGKSPGVCKGVNKLLAALPADLAKKIGLENAIALYKLKD